MPSKPNEKRESKHVAFIGSTGSGKTYKVKQLLAKNPDANVIVYDPYETYNDVLPYPKTFNRLGGLVRCAIERKERFRLAYAGNGDFELFCKLVWAAANGDHETYVVFEEAGSYISDSAKVSDTWYKMITVGRKYGVVVVAVVQRPQNLNKTVYDMLSKVWIGFCSGRSVDYMERDYKIDLSVIDPKTYSYYMVEGGKSVLFDKNDKPIKK